MTHHRRSITRPALRGVLAALALVAVALCAGCAPGREINNPFVGPNGSLDSPFGQAPTRAPAAADPS